MRAVICDCCDKTIRRPDEIEWYTVRINGHNCKYKTAILGDEINEELHLCENCYSEFEKYYKGVRREKNT